MGEPGVLARLKTDPKTVGARQTLRALQKGVARLVYVARDADPEVTGPIVELSQRQAVQVVYVDSMHALGRACGIDVAASVAAIVAGPDSSPDAKRQRKGGA